MQLPISMAGYSHSEDNMDVDDDEVQFLYTTRPMTGHCQTYRPSLTDDSRFSTKTSENILSPLFCLSVDEIDRQVSEWVQPLAKAITMTADKNGKEHVVIRQAIRCKKCNQKIIKEKFKAHCQSNHPKQTGERIASAGVTGNPPFSAEDKEVTQNQECSVKKTTTACPKDEYTGKFLTKELLLKDLGLCDRGLLSKFSTDFTTAILKVSPDTNDKINIPAAEEVAPFSPVVTTEPNTTTTIYPKPSDESAYKQCLRPKRALGPSKQRPLTRRPYQKRKFSCASCPNKFHTEEELLIHAQKHRMHQCNFCNEVCNDPHATSLHELNFHGDFSKINHPIPFGCPRCKQTFENVSAYKAHFWESHLSTTQPSFKCCICQETFEHVEAFKKHVSLKACKSTSSFSNLNNSDRNQEAEVPAEPQPGPSKVSKKDDRKCNICKLTCTSFFALQCHVVSHDPDIEPCSDCPRLCKDKARLKKHRKIFHSSAPVAAPAPTPVPVVGNIMVTSRKFCRHCNTWKTFTSLRAFKKHIYKHEIKPMARKLRRPSYFHNKQCSVCKQYFRNLGSHMKAHITQPRRREGAKEEPNRKNEEPEKNDDTGFGEESEDNPSRNEPTGEMEVDPELISNNDEGVSSTRKSLVDRVKLRQRRPSSSVTVLAFILDSSDDEDNCTSGRGKRKWSKLRLSRNRKRISRKGRNETKRDDKNKDDSVTERKKSKPIAVEEAPTTAPNNEELRNEQVNLENVDNAPNEEVDNTGKPLVNINCALPPLGENEVGKLPNKDDQCEIERRPSVIVYHSKLPPKSESKAGKVPNKDDQGKLERQTSVILNNSMLPPKKRPYSLSSLPPPVSDGQDKDKTTSSSSSCSTVLLPQNNTPKKTKSCNIQLNTSTEVTFQ